MSQNDALKLSQIRSLELFQTDPQASHGLNVAAHLAGIPRRSLLFYCRMGLVRPVYQPPNGIMTFTEEAIRTVRRIEDMRAVHRADLDWIKELFELLGEVDRLRAEVRFLRRH